MDLKFAMAHELSSLLRGSSTSCNHDCEIVMAPIYRITLPCRYNISLLVHIYDDNLTINIIKESERLDGNNILYSLGMVGFEASRPGFDPTSVIANVAAIHELLVTMFGRLSGQIQELRNLCACSQ